MISRFSAAFLVFSGSCLALACASSSESTSDEGSGGMLGTGAPSALAGSTSSPNGGAGDASSNAGGKATSGGASSTNAAGSPSTNGGMSAGGGASSAGGSSGGTNGTPTSAFAQVSALLDKRCAGSKCHSSDGMQLPFASATGSTLYGLLTTPIPNGTAHCVGVTLVTPNDAQSPLLEIVASGGKIACTSPKKESIGPMPDKCTPTSTTEPCLTAAEIQVLSAWVLAGAPQN